jgi:hypothetical protein
MSGRVFSLCLGSGKTLLCNKLCVLTLVAASEIKSLYYAVGTISCKNPCKIDTDRYTRKTGNLEKKKIYIAPKQLFDFPKKN